jgi:hypothetical protein
VCGRIFKKKVSGPMYYVQLSGTTFTYNCTRLYNYSTQYSPVLPEGLQYLVLRILHASMKNSVQLYQVLYIIHLLWGCLRCSCPLGGNFWFPTGSKPNFRAPFEHNFYQPTNTFLPRAILSKGSLLKSHTRPTIDCCRRTLAICFQPSRKIISISICPL